MLRQLLSISPAVLRRRPAFSTLELGATGSAAAPAVDAAEALFASRPEQQTVPPAPVAGRLHRGPQHQEAPSSRPGPPGIPDVWLINGQPHARTNWRWLKNLRAAAARGDVSTCAAILTQRVDRASPTSAWTARAFAEAVRLLPPRDGLVLYHLSQERGVEPTPTMSVSVIRMHAALGMLRHVEGAVREMAAAGLKPHWSTFFHWANVHAEAGDPEGVRRAAAAADAAGLEVTAHYQTMMVKALCKSGRPHATLHLLRDVRRTGVPPEPVWRALVHCHGLAGHALRAQEIFDEMLEAGVTPSASTWTALINAYAECRMPEAACATMAAMRAAHVAPNHQTYTTLLKAFAQQGGVRAALAAVADMRKQGLEPNAHVWGALVGTCAVSGDAPAARAAFEAMKEAGVPAGVVQFTTLLSAYRNSGDLAGALAVLSEMDKAGVRPAVETFTEVIILMGQHGMTEEAEEAFRALAAQGHVPDQIAFNVLAGALLGNWVDRGRQPGCDLLLRAEEVFREGWEAGVTRPGRETSADGDLVRVDLHWQGTWSGQLALLGVLNELLAASEAGHRAPALMVITGQGLKKRSAPLREVTLAMLGNMGAAARVSKSNSGSVIVSAGDVTKVLDQARREGGSFDVSHAHRFLVDPRSMDAGSVQAREMVG